MDKCREAFEQIPEIAERIKRSKMEYNSEHDFFHAPEWDSQSCSDQDFVNNFRKGWQSRQAEVDELNQLYFKAKHQEIRHRTIAQDAVALVEEKDKRIEELQAKVDAVEEVLGCAMIAPKEVFQYADRIGRALRGEHE